jgi:hypothetical protein
MSEVKTIEHPILFSTPMVQAILEGRKTQTRRIVSKSNSLHSLVWDAFDWSEVYVNSPVGLKVKCKGQEELWRIWPKWEVGDILWVRESFVYRDKHDKYYYKADHTQFDPYAHSGWKPSIHMPRAACRIRLQITDIRVERLQDISEEDAIAEGITPHNHSGNAWYFMENVYYTDDPVSAYEKLWSKINGEESWNQNPWVWAIAFKGLQ